MPAPLVADRRRPTALGLVIAAAALTAVLGVLLADTGATSFDRWALRRSQAHIGPDASRFLLHCSDPALSFGLVGVVAVAALLARRWPLLVLAVLAPAAAAGLTEYVLKPAIGRYMPLPGIDPQQFRALTGGAFPSGHETGVAAAAVLLFVAAGQLRMPPSARGALLAVLLGWTALAAVGLVCNRYHYATDTIGAIGVAVAVVLGGAMVLDLGAAALARRRAADRMAG